MITRVLPSLRKHAWAATSQLTTLSIGYISRYSRYSSKYNYSIGTSDSCQLAAAIAATKLINDLVNYKAGQPNNNAGEPLGATLIKNLRSYREFAFPTEVVEHYEEMFDPQQGVLLQDFEKAQDRIK